MRIRLSQSGSARRKLVSNFDSVGKQVSAGPYDDLTQLKQSGTGSFVALQTQYPLQS
jgi:hypothetical protein